MVAAVDTPVLTPAEGEAATGFDLVVTCATAGAEIHYTLNGATPTIYDPLVVSGGTVRISRNCTFKAKAWTTTESSAVVTSEFFVRGEVSAGSQHSLAIDSSGRVWAWGSYANGRLGNLATAPSSNVTTPGRSKYSSLTSLDDGVALSAGGSHSLVRRADGTVWSFGLNSSGQLGDTTLTDRNQAVQVRKSSSTSDMLANSVGVSGGADFSISLSATGEVYTWGSQASGRLGNGSTATGTRAYAGKVERGDIGTFDPLGGINRVVAGDTFGLAKEPSAMESPGGLGQVWVWGTGTSGALAQGSTSSLSRAFPMKMDASTILSDAWDIAAGSQHTVVVRWKTGDPLLQGRVYCTGNQANGRLGNSLSTSATLTYPVEVVKSGGVPLDGIVSVEAGSAHTLALDTNGNVWSWGLNSSSQLGTTQDTGDPDRGYRSYASMVRSPDAMGNLSNIVAISAGAAYSLAIDAEGNVYSWGSNTSGNLGHGTTTTYSYPKKIGSFSLVTPPDTGLSHAIAPESVPAAVTLTATPTDPDNNISKVEFFCQGQMIGQLTSPPWSLLVQNLEPGSYHAYAVVTDARNLTGHSQPVDFTVSPGAINDADGDGKTDAEEALAGTSPDDPDTDGDGILDGVDTAPLTPNIISPVAATTILVWKPSD